MRKALLGVLTLLCTVRPAAQTPLPPPAQAMDMTAADLPTMINTYPGGNADIKSINAGKHVVDLWLEQRKAGLTAAPGSGGIAHAEITEIYDIFHCPHRPGAQTRRGHHQRCAETEVIVGLTAQGSGLRA
jgi:hypothetical protein